MFNAFHVVLLDYTSQQSFAYDIELGIRSRFGATDSESAIRYFSIRSVFRDILI